ncbi:MAG: response regulator transcription factor [bacterium]|nr:response regulator transcription factor [bacterium]
MRILLVEDHQDIAHNIKNFLELENHQVDIASDGIQGLHKHEKIFYELILLDIMLPKLDGISLCKKIRATREVPIIMLTAKGQIEDKKEGFECGADDYLVKPFDLEELSMRIQSIMKRFVEPEKFNYKDIEIFLDEKKVLKKGKEVKINNKEFLLLSYLIQNVNIAISRTDILDYVRGEDLFENDDKIDVYISNLRRKLDKSLIQTIKGFGYKIEK